MVTLFFNSIWLLLAFPVPFGPSTYPPKMGPLIAVVALTSLWIWLLLASPVYAQPPASAQGPPVAAWADPFRRITLPSPSVAGCRYCKYPPPIRHNYRISIGFRKWNASKHSGKIDKQELRFLWTLGKWGNDILWFLILSLSAFLNNFRQGCKGSLIQLTAFC